MVLHHADLGVICHHSAVQAVLTSGALLTDRLTLFDNNNMFSANV